MIIILDTSTILSYLLARGPSNVSKIIHLAKKSKADYLVTGDKDLLSLNWIDNTDIITPKEFIDIYSKNY